MIKGTLHQEDITLINIYAPNTWQELLTATDVAKAMNGKLLRIKEEMTIKRKVTAEEIR